MRIEGRVRSFFVVVGFKKVVVKYLVIGSIILILIIIIVPCISEKKNLHVADRTLNNGGIESRIKLKLKLKEWHNAVYARQHIVDT